MQLMTVDEAVKNKLLEGPSNEMTYRGRMYMEQQTDGCFSLLEAKTIFHMPRFPNKWGVVDRWNNNHTIHHTEKLCFFPD